jgi:putative transposase
MARRWRCPDGGFVYHLLNRAVGRLALFNKPADYAAFEKVLRQAGEHFAMRLLCYVTMPNHWHLVVWPEHDGLLSAYVQWLSVTHVRRWHARNRSPRCQYSTFVDAPACQAGRVRAGRARRLLRGV